MAVYKIVEDGDPVLRRKCKPVPEITPNILKLLTNMADTMYANRGVGLAAPQIGISKRVIVVDVGEKLYEMINPVILDSKGEQCGEEGCLSFPDIFGEVTRAEEVLVKALNKEGQTVEVRAKGYLARAFQHEIDHLDGCLFIDKAKNVHRA